MVIRYNIANWGGPRPLPDAGPARPIGTAGEHRARLSARRNRHVGAGMASLLVHAAAIATLLLVVTPPLPPPPADKTLIELVFAQPAPEPAVQPEPLPSVAEAPPEQSPPPSEQPPPPEQPLPPAQPSPPPEELPPQPVPPTPDLIPPPPEPPPPGDVPPPPETARPPRPPPRPTAAPRPSPRPVEPAPVTGPARIAPATQPPAAATAASGAPVMDRSWVAAVSAWLAAHRTYPEQARERGDEGNVSIRFTVDRSGRMVAAAIVGSSGSPLLDNAALEMLRNARFSAFPPDMTQAQVTITTSLRYSLR